MPSKVPLTGVRLSPKVKSQAQDLAESWGVSLTALMGVALGQYLALHVPPAEPPETQHKPVKRVLKTKSRSARK
jgi:hypothetical protein